MSKHKTLTSVGIDVGTTTTQLVISKLTLENVMPGSSIPRICITGKSTVYVGYVHDTPLIDRKWIDALSLNTIIHAEYARAGFKAEDINTGAVIITGETAKKENAEQISHTLAGCAGDFVIATAGPDLEGVIAGKGSGAYQRAKQFSTRVLNIDIGGGTANIVIFDGETVQSTACLNVGGRLLEIDPHAQRVLYVAPPAKEILTDLKDPLKIGDRVDKERLLPLIGRMVEVLDQVLLGEELDPLTKRLLISGPLAGELKCACVFISGGVGTYFYNCEQDLFRHGDLGILFAQVLKENSRALSEMKIQQPDETLRATVLGAGQYTVNVSGSTTQIDSGFLPLRNLPVIQLAVSEAELLSFWRATRSRYVEEKLVAYWLPAIPKVNFAKINALARYFTTFQAEFPQDPLIILAKDDIGKVLGQAIKLHSHRLQVISLDELEIKEGDYVDIGKPLPNQEVVPIVVKTLVFSHT